jgi:hypothetical protein
MHHSSSADHALHDQNLIAGHAAGDLSDSERIRADALLLSCTGCADLRADLVAIATATTALSGVAHRPRDFRLTPEQAVRLRRGSWLRTLLRPFGTARSSVRPMAAAFTSLGIAGLLVANILPSLLGGAASAPAPRDLGAAPAATSAPAVQPVAGGQPGGSGGELQAFGQASPPAVGTVTGTKDDGASPAPGEVGLGAVESNSAEARRLSAESPSALAPSNPLVVGSLALLAVGLTLFVLRFAARRVR